LRTNVALSAKITLRAGYALFAVNSMLPRSALAPFESLRALISGSTLHAITTLRPGCSKHILCALKALHALLALLTLLALHAMIADAIGRHN
jgi:hypothetical protein